MSLLAMNSLYQNHMLAKQNRSLRQSSCVATSNWHMHFLSLFITFYKCFVAHKVSLLATDEVKTITDTVLELLKFLAKIKHAKCRNDITMTWNFENANRFEIMQIYDILIKRLHSKNDRSVFAFSHIVIFNDKYYQWLKIFISSKTQSTQKAITNG